MKHYNKKDRAESAGCGRLEKDCAGIPANDNPVAGMEVLMVNQEDCPGSADFWMARIKHALRGGNSNNGRNGA